MHKRGVALALAGCLMVAGGVLGSRPARAGEDVERRLERLEALLRAQTERVERLEDDVATWRARAEAAEQGAPPSTAAARAVPAPAVVAQPPREVDDGLVRTRARPAGPATPEGIAYAPAAATRLQRAPALVAASAAPSGVRWGGYLTAEMIANSREDTVFDLHRLILQVDAPITDCIDFTAEIELEHGGLGGGMDGEVRVEQAVVTARLADAFQPKIGAPLVPFGRFNLHHDDPLNDFTVRPWTARYLIPTGFGQPGLGVEGSVPLGCDTRLGYDVLLSSGFSDDVTASGGVRGGRQEWGEDNNENKQLWARLVLAGSNRWLDRYELAVSGTFGDLDDAGQEALTGYAVDWLLQKGPFELQGEYLRYDIDRQPGAAPDAVHGLDGLWVQAAWHFMPCAWRRCDTCLVTPASHFTLAARYQTTDLDDRRRGASFQDDAENVSLGLNYRLTERTVLRIDHSWIHALHAPDERELTISLSTYF